MKRGRTLRWISVKLQDGAAPDETVWIDVRKLDASWKKHDQYIGPLGTGDAIRGRYEGFGLWVGLNEEVWIPCVGLENGHICFTDGRHRFAWLRDQGARAIPIDVDPAIADEIRSKFRTDERVTLLPDTKLLLKNCD
jgi:hypothetical protein